jgi:hypothetical protein
VLSCDLSRPYLRGDIEAKVRVAKRYWSHPLTIRSFGTAGGEGHGGGGGGGQGMSENIHLGSARLYGSRVGVHVGNQIDVLVCTDLLLPLGNISRHWSCAIKSSSQNGIPGTRTTQNVREE